MKSIFLATLFMLGAYAQGKTVDQMTCSEAQSFANTHGFYLKLVDGHPQKMYPVVALEDVRCRGRERFAAPVWERTLDQDHCILSWYCRGN